MNAGDRQLDRSPRPARLRAALGLLALATAGCAKPEHPAPRAVGTLVFDLTPFTADGGCSPGADAIDATLETEVQVLVSSSLSSRVAERLAIGPDRAALAAELRRSVEAKRRRGALVVEVAVTNPDAAKARALCNALLAGYLDQRLELRLVKANDRLLWLSDQVSALEASNPASALLPRLKREVEDAELARASRWSDAHVLDACAPAR